MLAPILFRAMFVSALHLQCLFREQELRGETIDSTLDYGMNGIASKMRRRTPSNKED